MKIYNFGFVLKFYDKQKKTFINIEVVDQLWQLNEQSKKEYDTTIEIVKFIGSSFI